VTAIFISVRKRYCNVLLYTKIPEGLQQKLEGLEPLIPIAGAATAPGSGSNANKTCVYY